MNMHDVMLASALSKGNLAIIDRICKTPLEKVLASKLAGGVILPSEYQQVEWIGTSGTQYINTQYVSQDGDAFELNIAFPSIVDATVPIGSRSSGTYSTSTDQRYMVLSSSTPQLIWTTNQYKSARMPDYTIAETVTLDEFVTYNLNLLKYPPTASSVPVFLFAFNDVGTVNNLSTAKCARLTISNNGTPKRDLIPCYRISDSVIGMWDVVSNGFNLWDEAWQTGLYDTLTGAYTSNATRICTKNMIPVEPSSTLFISNSSAYGWAVFYKQDKSFRSAVLTTDGTIEVPPNAYYMHYDFAGGYGSTYQHDICINISNADKNGTYYPYSFYTNQGTGSFTKGGDV